MYFIKKKHVGDGEKREERMGNIDWGEKDKEALIIGFKPKRKKEETKKELWGKGEENELGRGSGGGERKTLG